MTPARALLPTALALCACGPSTPRATPPRPPRALADLPQPLRDYAQALTLTPADLCRRIGPEACDPAAPLDPDRAAVAACLTRTALDRAARPPATAEFWRQIPLRDAGHLTDVDAPQVRAAVDALFQRTQLAPAGHHQWAHLRQMYLQLDTERPAPWPDWAVLACFAALQQLKHW